MTDFSEFLIASDLDGTLFSSKGTAVQRNVDAIERFRAGGGLFTIATGRVELNIHRAIPHPESFLNAPGIMCNGAYLYDFVANKPLEEEFMDARIARELLAFAKREFPDAAPRVGAPGEVRVRDLENPYTVRDVSSYREECIRISPAESWRTDDWHKIVFRADAERIAQIRPLIERAFGDQLSVVQSFATILELQMKKTTKAAGIEKLRHHLGERSCTVIACGDYENDIPMLRTADVCVAPANAHPDVKALCDHVLCSNDEGVIADIIEYIEAGKILPKQK